MDAETVVQHGAASGVEIRVHGVGRQDLLDALGSPRVLVEGKGRAPTLVELPVVPRHRLELLNWSRLSRRAPGVLWYLAFPFTLVNLAGMMQPSGPVAEQRAHRAVVWVVAIALTATTAIWVLAIVERLLGVVDLPDALDRVRGQVAVVMAFLLLSGLIVARVLQRAESSRHRWSAAWHCVGLFGVYTAILVLRPSQIQLDIDGILRGYGVESPSDTQLADLLVGRAPIEAGQFPLWLDPVALVAYASMALSLVIALGAGIRGLFGQSRAAWAGTGLTILLGSALLNLLASSSLVGLSRLAAQTGPRFIPLIGKPDAHDVRHNLVSARFFDSYATTLVPVVALLMVVAVVLMGVIVAMPHPVRWAKSPQPRHDRGIWAHMTVARLPSSLSNVVLFAALTSVLAVQAGVVLSMRQLFDFRSTSDENGIIAIVRPPVYGYLALAALAVAVAVFVTIRRTNSLAPLREGLALVADVAGFWPIADHPLGGRSYRPAVIKGLQAALDRHPGERVVLVGHSQGSVLCAWALAHPDRDLQGSNPASVHLVTCGSPLKSLYATFFPTVFNEAFFACLGPSGGSKLTWVNFWRSTDPIAFPIEGVANDRLLPDPRTDERDARGHSDYWLDPDQEKEVRDALTRSAD
ncbi:hypothetical protein GCM10009772_47370 [Pseudonocardia alni subsp. carboxydivorans]|uniref:Lipase (Class 3) n=1 Tax=Pseudonocardia alni subsp. carboxydivorans TaxID=415010 RepID=A0ABU9AMK5_PSEA5